MKRKQTIRVRSQRELAPGIFDLWINTSLAQEAHAGQFICIYPKDKSTLLPRPLSICEVNREDMSLRLVYRVAGKGTEEFSHYCEGEAIDIMGILGNGFPVHAAQGKRVFLMGGGIGIPPMLELAKALKDAGNTEVNTIVGYRDENTFLKEDLDKYSAVYVATEDGSRGTKGNVMDAIEANGLCADILYACGPMPMLRAVKQYAASHHMQAYISLEERMACGVGACLGCVARTREIDSHSHVHNARICTEGPVFEAGEVEI